MTQSEVSPWNKSVIKKHFTFLQRRLAVGELCQKKFRKLIFMVYPQWQLLISLKKNRCVWSWLQTKKPETHSCRWNAIMHRMSSKFSDKIGKLTTPFDAQSIINCPEIHLNSWCYMNLLPPSQPITDQIVIVLHKRNTIKILIRFQKYVRS